MPRIVTFYIYYQLFFTTLIRSWPQHSLLVISEPSILCHYIFERSKRHFGMLKRQPYCLIVIGSKRPYWGIDIYSTLIKQTQRHWERHQKSSICPRRCLVQKVMFGANVWGHLWTSRQHQSNYDGPRWHCGQGSVSPLDLTGASC